MTIQWNKIEAKWQERWKSARAHESEPDSREKKFITVAYPYPNSPQHLGHGRTYTIADVHARYCRMRGYNVLFPMGFHYTGTPILGMAKRIASGDAEIMSGLRGIFGVPDDVIDTFSDPVKIADYFRAEIKKGMMEMGYSIDWRREFTTTDPGYQRFVEWQVGALREKGLIMQGSHPVGWCPADGNPVSQHDTMGDVEPDFTEYVILKFRAGRYVMPVATLRPETVLGATNVWANPDVTYSRTMIDGEEWVISAECARKLEFLGRDISHMGEIPGSELVGMEAVAPQGGAPVPVLGARFADPATGTGLVMSVPAHAPFDYRALADLRDTGDGTALRIKPIHIIRTDGYGDCPAREACEKFGVTNQDDPKLEDATSEVYGKEFYGGVMAESCGELAGLPVREARERAAAAFGVPWRLLELDAPVRCRCGAECTVKMLTSQWFLNYGDEGWKKKASGCLGSMEILPPEIAPEFGRVLEWLRERACARQQGLGTRLPWDQNWIVESLSDSVIYMAYYTISRFVNDGTINPGSLDRGTLDYILLGKGDARDGAAHTMRDEFSYYYPVDSRHSGRDLVPNHLSFFVLNHVALFPKEHWPQQIVVNGSVLMDGKKMSKSMGNIVPLRGAISRYGADPIRLATILSAELLQDADIDMGAIPSVSRKLESMLEACGAPEGTGGGAEDRWLQERLRRLVSSTTSAVDGMRLREALHGILFGFESEMQWHAKRARARGAEPGGAAVRAALEARVLMLSPFAPHAADEMWEMLGKKGTASGSAWPGPRGKPDPGIIRSEGLLMGIMEDISRILSVAGIKPKKITIYAASAVKSAAYGRMLELAKGGAEMKSVMRGLLDDPGTAWVKKDPGFVQKALKDILSDTAEAREARIEAGPLDEAGLLRKELASLARAEFGAEIAVYTETDPGIYDPRSKAASARPFKPAIFIE